MDDTSLPLRSRSLVRTHLPTAVLIVSAETEPVHVADRLRVIQAHRPLSAGVYRHVSDTGSSGIHAVINEFSTSNSNEQIAVTAGLRVRFSLKASDSCVSSERVRRRGGRVAEAGATGGYIPGDHHPELCSSMIWHPMPGVRMVDAM